jgi:ADP-ribosylglycohydrolase
MSNILLGGAIGDALGVFAESKLPDYEPLLSWDGKTYIGSEYHNLKPGQYSDDTMLSICVAESLIENNGFNPEDLSKRYVNLFTSNTIRGYGRTTLTAIQNLINGVHWSKSGVPDSYGNGTFMRASAFGIYFRHDIKSIIESATIDAKITHASNEAIAGSLAISIASALIANNESDSLLLKISGFLPSSKVKESIKNLEVLIKDDTLNPSDVIKKLGTRSDVRQSAPSVFYCYFKYNNYLEAAQTIIRCAGDTDTNCSALCNLYGAKYGKSHFLDYHIKNIENSDNLINLDYQIYNKH